MFVFGTNSCPSFFFHIIRLTIVKMPGNTSKRGWTPQEDQIIISMVSQSSEDKHKWVDVSKELFQKTGRQRTGKQCRERWQHQINPAIVRDQWTECQVITLFQMQSKFGNKWAQIAAFLPGRTDNAVKNFFYSSVRRVLTKINLYLAHQRKRKDFKTIRQFQAEYMSKLMSVVDGNYEKRLRLMYPEAHSLAKDILKQVSLFIISGLNENLQGVNQQLDSQILMMHEFRKSCKKRKQIHNYEDFGIQGNQSNIKDSSQLKDSSMSNSLSSSRLKRSFDESRLITNDSNLIQKMQISFQKSQLQRSQKTTQVSFEENNLLPEASQLEIKKIDSFYFQMPLSKGYSVLLEQNKEKFWNIFGGELIFKEEYLKMQQQYFEQRQKEVFDIVSMPFGYWDDYLGASRNYDQPQSVTKFKMLEVSLALDQCLPKLNNPNVLSTLNIQSVTSDI